MLDFRFQQGSINSWLYPEKPRIARFLPVQRRYWLAILETAKKLGWKPEGTRYDLLYQIDELYEEGADAMYNMFIVVQVSQWYNSWDRNYTDRENQIVTGEDAKYMRLNLENSGVNPRFLDFLAKGAFRICSM